MDDIISYILGINKTMHNRNFSLERTMQMSNVALAQQI